MHYLLGYDASKAGEPELEIEVWAKQFFGFMLMYHVNLGVAKQVLIQHSPEGPEEQEEQVPLHTCFPFSPLSVILCEVIIAGLKLASRMGDNWVILYGDSRLAVRLRLYGDSRLAMRLRKNNDKLFGLSQEAHKQI